MIVIRADGSTDESGLKRASAEMTLKFEEIPHLTIADRIQKLDELANQMAQEMSKHLFASLNESIDEAGQAVDGMGKPFDAELFFAVLEKMQLEFDEDGQQHNLAMVVAPQLGERVKVVFEQIDKDPILSQRHRSILQRKREEWSDREATRKLVG
jgi:hypothetical protein